MRLSIEDDCIPDRITHNVAPIREGKVKAASQEPPAGASEFPEPCQIGGGPQAQEGGAQVAMIGSCRDADLYPHDVQLFREGQWLNSSCINYCLRLLEESYHSRMGSDAAAAFLNGVLTMDPTVVHFLRAHCEDEEDFEQLAIDTSMREKTWVLLPINNNDSPVESTSCSHWSLLVVRCDRGESYHIDSSNRLNSEAAMKTSKVLEKVLKRSITCSDVASAPQQMNGNDCGVYVILYVQTILACLCGEGGFVCKTIGDIENEMKVNIKSSSANVYRSLMCNMFK